MAVKVVEITSDEHFQQLHQLLVDYFDDEIQCSPRSFYPSLNQIRRAPHVYVARFNTTPIVAALTKEDGHILWLNGYRPKLLEGATAIFARVYADLGACWGVVRNQAVRDALVQASGAAGHADGERIWWQP